MEFLTGGGLPAFRDVDVRCLRMFDLPVTGRADANQILLSVFVLVGQCQVWPLPEWVNVVHRISRDDCWIRTPQEREVIWVLMTPAPVPLIPLYLAPLPAPDGAVVELGAVSGSGDDVQHPAGRPGIRIKRRRCGGK